MPTYYQVPDNPESADNWRFISSHQLHVPLSDTSHLIALSGIVRVDFNEGGEDWHRDQLVLHLALPAFTTAADKCLRLDNFTPSVTINSIKNDGTAVNAGWAVDAFGLKPDVQPGWGWKVAREVILWADMAVRDSDGTLHRVAYNLLAVGELVDKPIAPGPQ